MGATLALSELEKAHIIVWYRDENRTIGYIARQLGHNPMAIRNFLIRAGLIPPDTRDLAYKVARAAMKKIQTAKRRYLQASKAARRYYAYKLASSLFFARSTLYSKRYSPEMVRNDTSLSTRRRKKRVPRPWRQLNRYRPTKFFWHLQKSSSTNVMVEKAYETIWNDPTRRKKCKCSVCRICRRKRKMKNVLLCPRFGCRHQATSHVKIMEHQFAEHGGIQQANQIIPHAGWLVTENMYLPPATVYICQQVAAPGILPERWSPKRIRQERKNIQEYDKTSSLIRTFQVMFESAYQDAKEGGQLELDRQYEKALAYYESSIVYPVSGRKVFDGTWQVGHGRNWLMSSGKENTMSMEGILMRDMEEEEEEIVLVDTLGAAEDSITVSRADADE